MKLELFYFESCPFCQIVLREIQNLNIESNIDKLNIHDDPSALERLVNMNGKRQVPCLVIDGKPMLESSQIIEFLQQNFG